MSGPGIKNGLSDSAYTEIDNENECRIIICILNSIFHFMQHIRILFCMQERECRRMSSI